MSPDPGPPLVVDSSALVALLADDGPAGSWVADAVAGATLFAPQLVSFEAANILRRQMVSGHLSRSEAALAHADLIVLPLDLWPYAPLAERVWELRENLTSYDASYVALAELLEAALVTLDVRLANAPGPRCRIQAFTP